ncbi:MAG: insulinase family protein [Erysipelotrichaceae bacterium]|nr:insulinase family protein [Erysipelotrichaceae bacterium]
MKITEGVHLQVIPTSKFKDISISIRFMADLHEEHATIRSLLALMLCDRCKRFDTKQKMSIHQDELYGVSLHAQTLGYGAAQVLDIRSKMIHPSYVKEPSLFEDVFRFLHEIIFSPLLNEAVFQESKKILQAKIERIEDEPAQYIVRKGFQVAGEGTPLAISSLGELEVLKKATLDDVCRLYQKMVEEDQIHILVCGDVNEEELQQLCKQYLSFTARKKKEGFVYCVSNDKEDVYKEEYRNVEQSNIMMLWFTNTNIQDKDYYALRVANAMFGQYPSSYLFQEVREKNSLCYTISSSLTAFDGTLSVTTGVENAQIHHAIDLIKKQFQRICNGDFDEQLIAISKTMIVNSLLATKDSMVSLIALSYQNAILSREQAVEDIIEHIQKVSREEIIAAMKKCELKMTLVLRKEEEHA